MSTGVLCRDTQIQYQNLLGSRVEQVAQMLGSDEGSRVVQGTGHGNSLGSRLELGLRRKVEVERHVVQPGLAAGALRSMAKAVWKRPVIRKMSFWRAAEVRGFGIEI